MLTKRSCWLLAAFTISMLGLTAQLSSIDIRQTSGKGPYPIYLGFQYINTNTKSSFRDFTRAYASDFGESPKSKLSGIEANLGIVINEENFLGFPGFKVSGIGLVLGYRYLERKVFDQNGRQLSIAQELMSLRLLKRFNIIYPLTLQTQVGIVFQNTASVQEVTPTSNRRITIGDRLFSSSLNERKGIFNGLDLRARLMLLDPAGTTGGIGFYFEGHFFCNCKKRDTAPFYERFLNRQVTELKSWNQFSLSVGLIIPLALPLPSSS